MWGEDSTIWASAAMGEQWYGGGVMVVRSMREVLLVVSEVDGGASVRPGFSIDTGSSYYIYMFLRMFS